MKNVLHIKFVLFKTILTMQRNQGRNFNWGEILRAILYCIITTVVCVTCDVAILYVYALHND